MEDNYPPPSFFNPRKLTLQLVALPQPTSWQPPSPNEERWGPCWQYSAQSTSHPEQNWSEEDWDRVKAKQKANANKRNAKIRTGSKGTWGIHSL